MKKQVCVFFLAFLSSFSFGQETYYQWPIKGVQTGKNILFKPQSYIDQEFNFGDLFLGANEGDTVISPTAGKISSLHYVYKTSLNSLTMLNSDVKDFETDIKKIVAEWNDSYDKKYLNVVFGIEIVNGTKIYISGLRPIKSFKTGEKISKGEAIGTVGYVYFKIQKSAISISISKNGKSADPMTPFGLETTFISPQAKKLKEFLTVEEMREDLNIFVEALKEGYPGLHDYISAEKFDSLIKQYFAKIKEPYSVFQFEVILKGIIGQIHDSHLAVLSNKYDTNNEDYYFSSINIGWLNDTLIVNRTLPQDKHLLGQRVLEVDGIHADSLKQIFEEYALLYIQHADGFSKSISDFRLLTGFVLDYFQYYPDASKTYDLNLKFSDGTKLDFKGIKLTGKACVNLQPDWQDFYTTNWNKKSNFSTKTLPNKTAYLGLSNFNLNEVEIDQVTQFIKSIADSNYQNLIIDVRNNPGGEDDVISQIYSLIAKKEFRMGVYNKVNKTGNFVFFKNCLNYSEDLPDIFNEYSNVKGKSGYYLYDDSIHKPHPITNFGGRVYVLANERSFSAAAFFPALVHKYKRGVVVGRETPTTYYHMNAEKFADVRLPNSQSAIHIPLVQIVFDTLIDSKIPWGRGVIPDYPVNFSLSELAYENGDSILNFTKRLIIEDRYLKGEVTDELGIKDDSVLINSVKNHTYIYFLFGIVVIAVVIIYFKLIKKMAK